MRDLRSARTLYLIFVLEAYAPHPGGRPELVRWIEAQLDAGPSDLHDRGPGDQTMKEIIKRYPGYLEQLQS